MGGFRHVPRGPTRGATNFLQHSNVPENNGQHWSERVKWIKATVMTKTVASLSGKINRGDTVELTADRRWWLKRSPVFFSMKNKICRPRWGPPHFLNSVLLRLNPARIYLWIAMTMTVHSGLGVLSFLQTYDRPGSSNGESRRIVQQARIPPDNFCLNARNVQFL